MTQTSPQLNLPYIQPAQAQKHVTHNEAIELLDVIVQLTVQNFDVATPAMAPSEGETWALGGEPLGVWTGHAYELATWRGNGWLFVTPQTGWQAYGVAPAQARVFDGTTWVSTIQAPVLENLPGLGVNASSDVTNKLAVSSDATLLNHAGSGHQLKLNKATQGDTASLLYQSNWSGRAEMGLSGDNDFTIKVSADGNTFTEALRIEATSGHVTLPQTPVRQILHYQYRHYLYSDRRWTSPSANPGSKNAYHNLGTAALPDITHDIKGLFVPAGTRLESFTFAGTISDSSVTDLDMCLFVHHGAWDQSWQSATQTERTILATQNEIGWTQHNAMNKTIVPLSHVMAADGYFFAATRASSGGSLSGTEYAYISGALDVLLPAL